MFENELFCCLQNALNKLVFIPFTVLLAIFILSLYFLLPETKGKTIEEITAGFEKKKTHSTSIDTKPTLTGSELGQDTKPGLQDYPAAGKYQSCDVTPL